jgi:hypothetical protein
MQYPLEYAAEKYVRLFIFVLHFSLAELIVQITKDPQPAIRDT